MIKKISEHIEKKYGVYIILLIVFVILFFIFFFVLNFPEIKNMELLPTTCLITNSIVNSTYVCEITYGTCQETSVTNICSDTLKIIDRGKSPSKCSNDTSYCLPPKTECDYGYDCCNQCCSTCKSCDNNNKCTTYDCNCYCCSSVNHATAYVSCDINYNDIINITYYGDNNKLLKISFVIKYGNKIKDASQYIKTYYNGYNTTCWYDPKDINHVILKNGYTLWKWIITGIVIMFIIILCILLCIPYFYICSCESNKDIEQKNLINRYEMDPPKYNNTDILPPKYNEIK